MGAGLGVRVDGDSKGRRPSLGMFHSNTMSPIHFFFMGHSSSGLDSRVTSGVSELHLRPKLGPAVGPVEAVTVMDVVEPMGETHSGHQQDDA